MACYFARPRAAARDHAGLPRPLPHPHPRDHGHLEDHHRPTTRHRTPSRTPRFHCRRTAAYASRASCDSVVARARPQPARPRRAQCSPWNCTFRCSFRCTFPFSTHFSPPLHPSLSFFVCLSVSSGTELCGARRRWSAQHLAHALALPPGESTACLACYWRRRVSHSRMMHVPTSTRSRGRWLEHPHRSLLRIVTQKHTRQVLSQMVTTTSISPSRHL